METRFSNSFGAWKLEIEVPVWQFWQGLPSEFSPYILRINRRKLNGLLSEVKVAQSCLTLCHPMDCSPPDSSVHGILQARILECFAIPFSRRSSRPRDWTQASLIAGRFFTIWTTREAHEQWAHEETGKRQKLCKAIAKNLCVLSHSVVSDSLPPYRL